MSTLQQQEAKNFLNEKSATLENQYTNVEKDISLHPTHEHKRDTSTPFKS
jgi:hypothetical protein